MTDLDKLIIVNKMRKNLKQENLIHQIFLFFFFSIMYFIYFNLIFLYLI